MPLKKQAQHNSNDNLSSDDLPRKRWKKGKRQEQDDGDEDDSDDEEELFSSTTEMRKRERQKKARSKEMTEEEMLDLALQLSKQEASSAALRMQQEEEDIKKAIEQSMSSQTPPCPPSPSQSPPADSDTITLPSRRKLAYPDLTGLSARDEGTSGGNCSTEPGLREAGDQHDNMTKKRKRKEGSPLPEMPDLSQTQQICSLASPFSSHSLSVPSQSTQVSDSTQNDSSELHKSPVFPQESSSLVCKLVIPKLSQALVSACNNSGMVLCSQETFTSSQYNLPSQLKSPTFPKSPALPQNPGLSKGPKSPKSPVFSETDQREDSETERSPSPVFTGSSHNKSVRHGTNDKTAAPLATEDRESSGERDSPTSSNHGFTSSNQESKDPSQCLKKGEAILQNEEDAELSTNHLGKIATPSKLDTEEELHVNDIPEDLNTDTELTSDMTLHWSDEEETKASGDSPSPVFPQEGPLRRPVNLSASPNHVAVSSPETPSLRHSPRSQGHGSISLCQQQQLPESNNHQTAIPEKEPHPPQNQQGPTSRASVPTDEQGDRERVTYYWGVPFCPRGLDPDIYTKVILAQMEVYEKSLKQAQRSLLRKAEWGEPILPKPKKPSSPASCADSFHLHVNRRRCAPAVTTDKGGMKLEPVLNQNGPTPDRRPGLRRRGKRPAETMSPKSPEGEEEEEEERKEEEEGKKEGEGKNIEEERKAEEEADVDFCEVCPETEPSDDDSTQDLILNKSKMYQLRPRPKSQSQPKIQTVPTQPTDEDQLNEVEVEALVDEETERSSRVRSPARGQDAQMEVAGAEAERRDAEEGREEVLQVSDSPDPAPTAASQDRNVECPICQGSFPMTEIEMHAAYCDGERGAADEEGSVVLLEEETEDYFKVSLRPRIKTRLKEVIEEEKPCPSDLVNRAAQRREKCFICHKTVPLRDYKRHTDDCIQRQSSKAQLKGDLLFALEQTESRDSEAAPSGSDFISRQREVIDLHYDEEPEPGGSGDDVRIRVSTSPIRAFTPISEATDCIIDFKNQYSAKQPSQKRGGKRNFKRFRR